MHIDNANGCRLELVASRKKISMQCEIAVGYLSLFFPPYSEPPVLLVNLSSIFQ